MDTIFFVDTANTEVDDDKFDVLRKFLSYLALTLSHRMKQQVGMVLFSGKVHRIEQPITGNLTKIQLALLHMK